MHRHDASDRARVRRDTLAGSKPALYLAIGLGAVTGGAVVLVMLGAALLVAAAGGVGSGPSELLALLGVSIAFWVGVSAGVILGVSVGFRTWVALYPAYERRNAAAEQRAAVREVEAWLRGSDEPPASD
jgi:hypothetical protein